MSITSQTLSRKRNGQLHTLPEETEVTREFSIEQTTIIIKILGRKIYKEKEIVRDLET